MNNLGERWETTFRLIEEGGFLSGTVAQRQLTWREREHVRVNILAFLFGPFYYFYLGMWRRGGLILGAALVLAAVLELLAWYIGVRNTSRVDGLLIEAFCAHRANLDYYFFKRRGQTMWTSMKWLDFRAAAWVGPALGVAAVASATSLVPGTCKDKEVLDSVHELIEADLKQRFGHGMDVLVTDPSSLKRDVGNFSQQCSARLSIHDRDRVEVYRVLFETKSGNAPLTTRVRIKDIVPP